MSATQILDGLIELTNLLQADQDRELGAMGLNQTRTHALWILHHGGPVMQRDLAEAMQVTPRHITTIVDELIESGFVLRVPHPADRRAVLVSLTEKGTSAMEAMVVDHQKLAGDLVEGLSTEHLAALQQGIAHVTTRLAALMAAAHPEDDVTQARDGS